MIYGAPSHLAQFPVQSSRRIRCRTPAACRRYMYSQQTPAALWVHPSRSRTVAGLPSNHVSLRSSVLRQPIAPDLHQMQPAFQAQSLDGQRFVVEVFSELDQQTVQSRWQAVNVILRLSMLTGLQMQLEPTLNLLLDYAAEISPYYMALVY